MSPRVRGSSSSLSALVALVRMYPCESQHNHTAPDVNTGSNTKSVLNSATIGRRFLASYVKSTMIFRSKLPKKRRRVLQAHEVKPQVGRNITATLLGAMGNRPVGNAVQTTLNNMSNPVTSMLMPFPAHSLLISQSIARRKDSQSSADRADGVSHNHSRASTVRSASRTGSGSSPKRKTSRSGNGPKML